MQDSQDEISRKWSSYFNCKNLKKEIKNENFKDVNSKNQNILHYFCMHTFIEGIIKVLEENEERLNNKLDISLKDNVKGNTPLIELISSSDTVDPNIIHMLLKSNCSVSATNFLGLSSIHFASFFGLDEGLKELVNHASKDDINAKDKLGRTPIIYSIIEGQLNSAIILLEYGADIHTEDNEGNSLLHYAVSTKGNSYLFSVILLEKGINVNKQNNKGDTPIMCAARRGEWRVVRKLLMSGAKYKGIINRNSQSFLSIMGEQYLRENNIKDADYIIQHENRISTEYNIRLYLDKKKEKKGWEFYIGVFFVLVGIILNIIK